MRLYEELASWWSILSPPATYADEAEQVLGLFAAGAGRPVGSLLELGSGAGHLAAQWPDDLDVVLLDRAEPMLEASRRLNPGRVHVRDDLRTARLDRTFDAVLLHDAVMYLTSVEDLRAAIATAAAHLAPGGVLLVVPDVVKETFQEGTVAGGGEDGDRAVQMLEWHWDPDPTDDTYVVEFSLLLRERVGDAVRVRNVHETHTMGLYDRATVWAAIRAAGLTPTEADPYLAAQVGEVFLARRA